MTLDWEAAWLRDGGAATPSTAKTLEACGLDPEAVARVVRARSPRILAPDMVDVTSAATIPAAQTGTADLVARADGVIAGLAVAAAVFESVDPGAT